jgi:hypothetical protein
MFHNRYLLDVKELLTVSMTFLTFRIISLTRDLVPL